MSMEAKQEKALFDIAKDQGGYFSLSQANSAGIRRNQVYRAVQQGTIERSSYAGVYRLSLYPVVQFDEIFAALVSLGENAVIGFESALYIYGLSDIIPFEIHVIMPRSSSRRRNQIKMHTCKLDDKDITSFEGFRITTVERTIIDLLISHADIDQVRMAIEQAISRGLTTKEKLINRARKQSKAMHRTVEALIGQEV